MDSQLSVVIPAYNEEAGIEASCKAIKENLFKLNISYEIIVVDDGSTDRTGEIAERIDGIKLIKHGSNKGYGASLKDGIRSANGDWILIIDADGTYPASEIPHLLRFFEYDMIVGSRTGNERSIQFYRKPAKWFLTKLANYLSGYDIPDLNSGMRAFRKNEVMKYFYILPNGFSFTTTITLAYHSSGLTVKYIPINYKIRMGSSKIKPLHDGLNFILLILTSIVFFHPLKIFIPISIIMLFASIFVAAYSILILNDFLDVTTVILFISSIQIGLFGLMADLIVRSRGK